MCETTRMVAEGRAAQIPNTIAVNVVATSAVLIEKRLNDAVTYFLGFSRITVAITESRRLIFHCQKRRLRDFGSSHGSPLGFVQM